MAKATLLEPTTQVGGTFTTIEGVLLELGIPTEISNHNAMLYMDSRNIKVEFDNSDFKDMDSSVLDNMAKKLKVDISAVKGMVTPEDKTITKKATSAIKNTLKGVTPKLKKVVVEEVVVEELVEEEVETLTEEVTTEDTSFDE